jgi:hypothetical protein
LEKLGTQRDEIIEMLGEVFVGDLDDAHTGLRSNLGC